MSAVLAPVHRHSWQPLLPFVLVLVCLPALDRRRSEVTPTRSGDVAEARQSLATSR